MPAGNTIKRKTSKSKLTSHLIGQRRLLKFKNMSMFWRLTDSVFVSAVVRIHRGGRRLPPLIQIKGTDG